MQEKITTPIKFYWNSSSNLHNNTKMYYGSAWSVRYWHKLNLLELLLREQLTALSLTFLEFPLEKFQKGSLLQLLKDFVKKNFEKIQSSVKIQSNVKIQSSVFEDFKKRSCQQWLSISCQIRRQISFRLGGGFMKWNSELHQGSRSAQQRNLILRKKSKTTI